MTTVSETLGPDAQSPDAATLERSWQAWPGSFPEFMRDLDVRQVPYLSHSKVATVERCPRCYYEQFVRGQQPTSSALTTGTLFHEVAAAFYEARRTLSAGAAAEIAPPPAPVHPYPSEQPFLDGAIATLVRQAWTGADVVSVETIFFLDLAPGLAPVIGIADLVLRTSEGYVVVDHKTSKRFGDPDPGQLALYAEHVRRLYPGARCSAAFDEYRLVPNPVRARSPVFRRTAVTVEPQDVATLARRYERASQAMDRVRRAGRAAPGPECWFCRRG